MMHPFKSLFVLCAAVVFASNRSSEVLELNYLVKVVGDLPLTIESDTVEVIYTAKLSVPKPQVTVITNKRLSIARATVAMEHTNFFNSTTSEFYVNLVDNTYVHYMNAVNPGYAVFGTVVQGIDLLSMKHFNAVSLL